MSDHLGKAGFSLLEVLASLALMALSLALVVPSFSTAIARIDQRSAVGRLHVQLVTERFRVLNEGISLRLEGVEGVILVENPTAPAGNDDRIQPLRLLPSPGWTVTTESSLEISPSKGCSGGPLRLTKDSGESVRLSVGVECGLTRAQRF